MLKFYENICSSCNLLNKNTLLIDCLPEFLLEYIYKPIECFIENLYVVSNNPVFLQITDRLLSTNQFEEIHRNMRNTLLLNSMSNCCIIVELDDLNYTDKYLADMILNKDNNITLICYSRQPIHISKYSHDFANIFVKKTNEDFLLKLYFAQYFSDIFGKYSDFIGWIEYTPDAYLVKINGKNPDYIENRLRNDISYTIKKSPINFLE